MIHSTQAFPPNVDRYLALCAVYWRIELVDVHYEQYLFVMNMCHHIPSYYSLHNFIYLGMEILEFFYMEVKNATIH